jgi:hypothetical protein
MNGGKYCVGYATPRHRFGGAVYSDLNHSRGGAIS